MKCSSVVGAIARWLMIIGAVNWGLVGIGGFMGANWNLVNILLGQWPMVESLVYLIVGIAGIMSAIGCRDCSCAPSQNG